MQISNPSGLCQLGGLFRATCLVGKADDVTGTMAFPLGARTIAEASSCPPSPSPPSVVFSHKSGDLPSECLKPFWDPTLGQRDTKNVGGEGRGCFSEG